jgi:hypothetical protein
MRLHITIILLLLSASQAAAQSLADLERQLDSLLNKKPKSEVVIGLGFGNNPAYGGKSTDPFRPVTMKSFLSPNISYNHKSGLYASVYSYYLLNATRNPWFELDLNAGYDYTKHKNFISGISYTRYFYKDSSDIPVTPITNEVFAYFFYRKWWLEPGLSVDFGWGRFKEQVTRRAERTITGSDFNIIADVRHSFIFLDVLKKDAAVLLMPVASFTAGTAHYYSNLKSFQYVSRSKLIKRRRNDTEVTISDKTGFQPRAVDLGVRLSYIIGKVTISPSYTAFKLLQGEDNGITGYFTASVSVTL